MTKLAIYLKDTRLKSLIKQNELARVINTTPQYISNVEAGLCVPAINRLNKWCDHIRADKKKVVKLILAQYKEKLELNLRQR